MVYAMTPQSPVHVLTKSGSYIGKGSGRTIRHVGRQMGADSISRLESADMGSNGLYDTRSI